MSGMDRNTGAELSGWPHVEQSLGVLLTTPKFSRVMRRAVGAGLPGRVDMAINSNNFIDLFADIGKAVFDYEPRFRPTKMTPSAGSSRSEIVIDVEGIYFPRGHLGDFTVAKPQSLAVTL